MFIYQTKLAAVLCLLTVTGCVGLKTVSDIPVTEEDFAKSPEQVLNDYSDIERFSFSVNSAAVPDQESLSVLQEKWGAPDEVENVTNQTFLHRTAGLGAYLLPLTLLAPDAGSLATAMLAAGAEIGLIYAFFPTLENQVWNKGNFRITSTTQTFNDTQRLINWEWEYKDDTCDCYIDLISKRSPTATFLDIKMGTRFSSIYLDGKKYETDPAFSFEFSPGINFSFDTPTKLDLSLAMDVSQNSYRTNPQINIDSIIQSGIRLGIHKPFGNKHQIRAGFGASMPIITAYRQNNRYYKMDDFIPDWFVRVDYMGARNLQLGYELSYSRLDYTAGKRLEINDIALHASLTNFF